MIKIAELKKYHEETISLLKYYYMDIPHDICMALIEFDDKYTAKLLGPDWHKYLFDSYEDFKSENRSDNKSKDSLKTKFTEQNLKAFYELMDYIFREGFGTASKTYKQVASGFTGLLFGE